MKDLGTVVRLVLTEKKDLFLSILCGFFAGIAAVGLFASSGYLISKAALAPPIYTLTVFMASLKLFGIASALSRYAERYFSHRTTFTILSKLRVSFFEKLEPLTPGIFQKYRSGDLLARIVGDVESLQNFFLRVFYPPIVLVFIFLSTIFFTSFFSIYIALSLLVGLVLTGFIIPTLFALHQRSVESDVRKERGELSIEVTELLYGFRDLKIYQKLEGKEQQIIEASDSYVKEQERKGINDKFGNSLNLFAGLAVSWFILAIGAYLVVNGKFDGIYLAMLVMISLTVFENTTPMAVLPGHFEDSRRAATRLNAIAKNESSNKAVVENLEQIETHHAVSVEMNAISFTFPNEGRKALDHVSLYLPAGSKTAIVGPSGSGKSTLLQLILKVFPTDEGTIKIDDVSIEQMSQETIWNATNVILQENHFFYGSIRENLIIAKDSLSDEEMFEVLMKVNLEGFTLQDSVFEKGENLSGGEKQRLALGRAMLRGKHLWLLDEPTSSVDALTEQLILNHLFEQAKDDTLVLVSHRLSGLEKMDKIIVMDHGKIIENGSYIELLEKKGAFYEMKKIERNVFG